MNVTQTFHENSVHFQISIDRIHHFQLSAGSNLLNQCAGETDAPIMYFTSLGFAGDVKLSRTRWNKTNKSNMEWSLSWMAGISPEHRPKGGRLAIHMWPLVCLEFHFCCKLFPKKSASNAIATISWAEIRTFRVQGTLHGSYPPISRIEFWGVALLHDDWLNHNVDQLVWEGVTWTVGSVTSEKKNTWQILQKDLARTWQNRSEQHQVLLQDSAQISCDGDSDGLWGAFRVSSRQVILLDFGQLWAAEHENFDLFSSYFQIGT